MTNGPLGHWNLSQVVTLLQHEFPEVTISKIRFMESQGLISPERSPSGNRRFYQGDYERLHWILVQQRDSYLPLRVIRDRLNSGERLPEVTPPDVVFEEPAFGNDDFELNLTDDAADLDPIPAQEQQHREQPKTASMPPQSREMPVQYSQPQPQPQPRPEPQPRALPQRQPQRQPQPQPQPRPQQQPQALQARPRVKNERIDWASELDERLSVPVPGPAPEAEPDKPSDVSKGAVSAAQPLYTRLTPVEGTQASLGLDIPESTHAPAEPQRLPGMSVSMRADELARSAGVEPTFITELTRYSIIEPSDDSDSSQYSNDTLEIVRLAAEFSEFGLEPRHMRTILLSAEREVELYAQTVGAGLRAGNPESRRQAHRNLGDLATKAASMRAVMIKRMLRTLTP